MSIYNENLETDTNHQNQYADDGVYGDISEEELHRLMESRKQRYMEGYNRPIQTNRTISTKLMITIIILLFLYYMTFFGLNVAGVINSLVMVLCMLPVTLGVIITYLVFKKKNTDF